MLKKLSVLLFLLSAITCLAQPGYIPNSGNDAEGVFNCSVTTNTSIPTGAAILFASYSGAAVPNDSHSDTYTLLTEVGSGWFLYGAINNSPGFVTTSSSTGTELQSCTVVAYLGVASPITVDTSAFSPAVDWTASRSHTIGPITTANTTDLLVTGLLATGNEGTPNLSASGYNLNFSGSTASNVFLSQYVPTTGTYSANLTLSGIESPQSTNGIFLVALKANGPPPSTATLTGTIQYPSGTLFNGKLSITLPRSSVLNICENPYQIVRAAPVNVPVVNGVPTGEFDTFLANYCLTPSVPYYVQLIDSKNVVVDSTNWMVIPDNTGHMNVGDLVTSGFGGPIVVAVPNPIVTNPAGAQVITQPVGTALSINNLTCTGICTGFQASTFAVTPSVCPSGFFSTGIMPNGNSICALIGTGVTSFGPASFGRTGAVVPQTGDYSYSMISGTPTLFNQNLYSNTTVQAQTTGLDFSSNFVLGTEGTPNANTVDLINIGTAGTYPNPSSIVLDTKGRVLSISGGSSGACGTFLGTSCTVLPGGLLFEWGTTSGLGGSWPGSLPVAFPVAFPTICYTVSVSSIFVGREVAIASKSNTGFVATISGSTGEAEWFAIGK